MSQRVCSSKEPSCKFSYRLRINPGVALWPGWAIIMSRPHCPYFHYGFFASCNKTFCTIVQPDRIPTKTPYSVWSKPNPSPSIADEQTYAWQPPEASEGSTFYFDVGELVRFRVESEEWHDHAPTGPTQSKKAKERLRKQRERQETNGQILNRDSAMGLEAMAEIEARAPYVVLVSSFLLCSLFVLICFPSLLLGFR